MSLLLFCLNANAGVSHDMFFLVKHVLRTLVAESSNMLINSFLQYQGHCAYIVHKFSVLHYSNVPFFLVLLCICLNLDDFSKVKTHVWNLL